MLVVRGNALSPCVAIRSRLARCAIGHVAGLLHGLYGFLGSHKRGGFERLEMPCLANGECSGRRADVVRHLCYRHDVVVAESEPEALQLTPKFFDSRTRASFSFSGFFTIAAMASAVYAACTR